MKKLILSLIALVGFVGLSNAASKSFDRHPDRVPRNFRSEIAAMAAGVTGGESFEEVLQKPGGEEYLFTFGYQSGISNGMEEPYLSKWMKNDSFAFGYKRGQEDRKSGYKIPSGFFSETRRK